MRANAKKLPDSELEIMQIVWNLAEKKESEGNANAVFRSEIEEQLSSIHPMAMTTLLTLLTRLSEKGFVSIQKEGRKSTYIPLIPKAEYQAQQSRSFLDKMFGGDISSFAAALQGSGLKKEDLAELRKLLEDDMI